MEDQTILWTLFSVMVIGALAIDLGMFQRTAHVVKAREAAIWTCVWIGLAFVFNAFVWKYKGPEAASQFLAGFLIEKSLSVDNLFVFLMIFSYFSIPQQYEARILLWGIVGALIMRALFIVVGSALMEAFAWMPFVFGVILLYTGFKLLWKKDEDIQPDRNPVLRLFKRLFPVTTQLDGQRFFSRVPISTGGGGEGGGSVAGTATRLVATPLFIVLIVVETTDVIFAVDSIPAIFAITTDPFIVYTSNVFAILGLRALYFLLARMMNVFRFLKYGLVIILWFVGAKMLVGAHPIQFHVPIGISLGVIGAVLLGSVALSLLIRAPHEHPPATQPPP